MATHRASVSTSKSTLTRARNHGSGTPPRKPESSSHVLAPPAVLDAATADAGVALKPRAYDPVAAEKALTALRPRLIAIPADQLATLRVDVRTAALGAMNLHAYVTQAPSLNARLHKLHQAGEFEITLLEALWDVTTVVLFTFAQAEAAGAFETEARVPAPILTEATALESRMQELLEYKYKRDPDIAPLLALLRPGTGHRDLAADLLGYADIYAQKHPELATDTTNYRPTDLADARRLAGEILSHLSAAMTLKARAAYDLLQRAWTLLLQIHTEVRHVGTCLLRYDPKRHEKLPSLFAAGRSGRPRKKVEEPVGSSEPAGNPEK